MFIIKFCVSTILTHIALQVYLNAKSAGQLPFGIQIFYYYTQK